MESAPKNTLRLWLVRWLYAVASAHLLGGLAITWLGFNPLLEGYHHSIEEAFWGNDIPTAGRGMQVWWLALLGATVQSYAIYMFALVHLGNRYRSSTVWGWLMLGLTVWAPQDMLVSLQVGISVHVLADAIALACLLPPLAWLFQHDRQARNPAWPASNCIKPGIADQRHLPRSLAAKESHQ